MEICEGHRWDTQVLGTWTREWVGNSSSYWVLTACIESWLHPAFAVRHWDESHFDN
jgi:hypothetical protein